MTTAKINGYNVPVCGGKLKWGKREVRHSFGMMYPYTCKSCGSKGASLRKISNTCTKELKPFHLYTKEERQAMKAPSRKGEK